MTGLIEQSHEHVEDAFQCMDGQAYRFPEVMYLVARGDLTYKTASWDSPPVTDSDITANWQGGPGTSTESGGHVEQKVMMARFLDELGYDLPSEQTPNGVRYKCFERPAGGLNSDVVGRTQNGLVSGEVGYVPAKYLLRVFGYTSHAPVGDVEAMQDGGLYRKEESDVGVFVTRPYKSNEFHLFQAVDLPEPERDKLSSEIDEMID